MLATAIRLMQSGDTPSVSEVAEAAGVSRATAYRYFPSQTALVSAVVDEALGPLLTWSSRSQDAGKRVRALIDSGLPRIDEFEATFKAALKLSLEQWAQGRAGTLDAGPPFKRGHRVQLIAEALGPLKTSIPPKKLERLSQGLSLVFGIETLIVLKDIWGLDGQEAKSVAQWVGEALVEATVSEVEEQKRSS